MSEEMTKPRRGSARVTLGFVFRLLQFTGVVFGLLIVVAISLGAILWMNESPALARYVSRTITEEAFAEGCRLEIDDIQGSPFDTVVLEGVRVFSASGDTLLRARAARFRYPVAWGLKGRLAVETLGVDDLLVNLHEEPEGDGLVVPWRVAEQPRGPDLRPRGYGVEALAITRATVTLTQREGTVDTLVAGANVVGRLFTDADGVTTLQVDRGQARVPIGLVDVDRFTAMATLHDDRIQFLGAEARVGQSFLSGTGMVSVAGPPRLAFDVVVEHVDTDDFHAVVDLGEVLGHGELEGRVRVERVPKAVGLEWELRGTLNGDPIDRLAGRGRVNLEVFEADEIEVHSREARVKGALRVDLIAPRDLEAEVDVSEVDLSDLPIHDELVPLHPHRATGHVSIVGHDYELLFPHMDVHARLVASTYVDVPLDSLEARISLRPDHPDSATGVVRIRSASAFQGDGWVAAAGVIVPEDTCDVVVRARSLPLPTYLALHDVPELRGRASLDGRVFGDVLHPRYEGRGWLDGFALDEVRVTRISIPEASGRLDPFTADFRARGGDGAVGVWAVDSVKTEASIGDGRIRVDRLEVIRGDSLLVGRGYLLPRADGVSGTLTDLDAILPTTTARARGATNLEWTADGSWHVGPATLDAGGGTLTLELVTGPDGQAARLDLAGDDVRLLDVFEIPGADSLSGAPSDFAIAYADGPQGPVLEGHGEVRDVILGETRIDRLVATFVGGADSLRVDDVRVELHGGVIEAGGVARRPGGVVGPLLGPDPVGDLVRPDTELRADLDGRDLDLQIPGRIRAFLGLETASPTDRGGLESVVVIDERRVNPWRDVIGRGDATLHLEGLLAEPEVRGWFATDSIQVADDLLLDAVEVLAVYRDSLLTVSQCDVVAGGKRAQLSGFVPVDLGLDRTTFTLLDREMLLSVDMAETPLWLATLVLPELIVSQGSFTGTGTVEGSPLDPEASGTFRLTGGEGRWFGRPELFREGTATVTLSGGSILVNHFEAKEGRNGRVWGSGRYRSPSEFRFQATLEDVHIVEGGMTGLIDGVVNVSPDSTTAGRLLSRIDGRLHLKQGEIVSFEVERPEFTTEAIDAIYDLEIDVGRIYVNTNELQTSTNILIGDGTLTVRNYPELRLTGQLEVLEGSASVYGNSFRITHGQLDFFGVEEVNPELDIRAETRLRGPYARERGYEDLDARIVATVTGTLKEPVIQLTTDPEGLGLSHNDILEYLTYGRFGGGDDALEPTADLLIALISQDLTWIFPYVDYVDVIDTEDERAFRIVKNLSDELTIGYTTGVSSTPDQELSIEARLSRIFVLKGGVVREEVGSASDVGGRYNLDLRLNFEY